MLGTAATVDENRAFEKSKQRRAGNGQDDEASDDASGSGAIAAPSLDSDPSQLVPWVNLKH